MTKKNLCVVKPVVKATYINYVRVLYRMVKIPLMVVFLCVVTNVVKAAYDALVEVGECGCLW